MNVHYSTLNGDRTGRASHFYRDDSKALAQTVHQNLKARNMGVNFEYEVAKCDESLIPKTEKVRA